MAVITDARDDPDPGATDAEPPGRPGRVGLGGRAWMPVALFLLGLWITRGAWGGIVPHGDDVPYHLARARFGWSTIFRSGNLDGWSPLHGAGSQAFLLYGPGLALTFSAVKAIGLGQLGDGATLAAIMTTTYAAIGPSMWFLARSLRLSHVAAGCSGLLALCVSVPFGVGVAGTFDLGLVANQLAAPLFCCGLALLIRLVASDEPTGRRGPLGRDHVLAAAVCTALLITHPATAVVLAVTASLLLPVVVFGLAQPFRRCYRLVVAGALTALLSAWWWLPLVADHAPRAPSPDWATPPFWDRVQEIVEGRLVFSPPIATLVVTSLAVVGLSLLGRRSAVWTQLLGPGLVLAGPLLLLVGYGLHYTLGQSADAANLIPNRGLGYVGLLLCLPAGLFLSMLIDLLPRPERWAPAVLAAAMLTVAFRPSLIPVSTEIGHLDALPPQVVGTAIALRDDMPRWSRFVFAQDTQFRRRMGIVHPEMWIAELAGRNTVADFGGNSVSGFDNYLQDHIFDRDPAATDATLAAAGVTHLIVGQEDQPKMAQRRSWEPVWDNGIAWLYRRTTPAGHPRPDALLTTSGPAELRLTGWSPERIEWRKDSAAPVVATVAVAAFGKWHVRAGGSELATRATRDGLLEVDIPGGTGDVVATFERTWVDRWSLVLSGLTLVGLAAWWHLTRRRAPGPGSGGGLDDGDRVDHHVLLGPVAGSGGDRLDALQDVESRDHLAEQ